MPEPYEFRMVNPDEFPELDREFYDHYRHGFESRGFRFLGDREDVLAGRLSGDGTTGDTGRYRRFVGGSRRPLDLSLSV
jgi:hypothetical protein